jgi:hypothetical protein
VLMIPAAAPESVIPETVPGGKPVMLVVAAGKRPTSPFTTEKPAPATVMPWLARTEKLPADFRMDWADVGVEKPNDKVTAAMAENIRGRCLIGACLDPECPDRGEVVGPRISLLRESMFMFSTILSPGT